jgi:hypothetical protein
MKSEKSPLTIVGSAATDVVFIEFKPNLKVDLQMAKQIVASRLNFMGNKKHYLVLDMSNVRNVTAEAKKFLQLPEGGLKNILAAALIASNPVAALIANVFIKTPKDFQAQFFRSKKDAIDWIHLRRQASFSSQIL